MRDLSSTIYISQNDEITSVLDKVLQNSASKIFLVVPAGSLILKSIINLRILKEESENGNIHLIVVTSDPTGLAFAKKVKLNYSENLFGDIPEQNNQEVISLQRPKIAISLSKINPIGFIKERVFYLSFLLFVAVALIFSFLSLPSATVFVLATPNTIAEQIDLQIDTSLSEYSFSENKIPGRIAKIEENFSKVIISTGEKEIKEYASGQITLLNEWDSNNQTIIEGTQLRHESGKSFKIKSTVIIPGFSRAGGDDVAGKIVASVIATEPGPQFNISAGKFFITALSNTAKYDKIYGASSKAMEGGRVGKETFISKEDIETANAFVKEQMNIISGNENKFDKGSNEIILENSVSSSIGKIELNAKQGDQQKEFSIKAVIYKEAILVDTTVVESFAEEWLTKRGGSNANIKFGENISILPSNPGEAKNKLWIEIVSESDSSLSLNEIEEMILGKGEIEAKQILGGIGTVENYDIKLWPFWVNKIPNCSEKVRVFLDKNYYFSIIN